MAQATETGRVLTEMSRSMAISAEQDFLLKPTLGNAGRFIDIVAELGPRIFVPNDGSLEAALKVAKDNLDSMQLPDQAREDCHNYFRAVARAYCITYERE